MSGVTRQVRTATLLPFLLLSLSFCHGDRPDPGSDLPPVPEAGLADAPDERGPVQSGASLAGSYVAPTQAATSDGLVKVPIRFVFAMTQTGTISEGTALLSGSVQIEGYEARTTRPFDAIAVSSEGRFRIDVEDMLIPKELNSLLAEDVTDTSVSFLDVQVASSCEFTGKMQGVLRQVNSKLGVLPEVIVAGDFVATGSQAECAGDASTDAASEVGP